MKFGKFYLKTQLLALVLAGISMSVSAAQDSFTQFVNPYIGTGGHGHVFLGANVPFGAVQLGPTQITRGWDWCSGYHYSDSLIIGFGHMHLSGTGIGDLGDIAFLPTFDAKTYTERFSHDAEYVRPGYYTVRLADSKILVELTATQRAGMHRYTYPLSSKQPLLKLNLKQGIGWDKMTKCQLTQENPTTVSGYRLSEGWAKDQRVYFVAEFSRAVKLQEMQADSVGVFSFDDATKPLLVRVGISAVSVDNAKANLRAEIKDWNFDRVAQEADAAWNDELGKIKVETPNLDDKTIFYTGLYHTMTAPSVFSDVNGQYRGSDGKIYQGDFVNYTTLSLWDTYRAAHPLMTIIHPEKQRDIAQTFLHIFQQQGKLPVWHLVGNETDCMVGNPGIPVLADIVLKGFDVDKKAAYQAMRTSALLDERSLDNLKKFGYIPWNRDSTFETVAKGLEYALADACVAKVAKLLGEKKDYQYFFNRSKSYKYYFDKKTGFMRGVDNGKFREPFNPFHSSHRNDDYTEGNAWQYTWLVPHDVPGLIKLFGGKRPFVTKLDSLFTISGDLGENASPDISGLIGQYAHGNEPSHHILYMYNYVGQHDKTAEKVREVLKTMYHNDFDGLSGNEDVGQMSAWYILSSLGIYQVEPAGGRYMFGSPLFDKAVVNVGKGKTFTIIAHNNSAKNVYVHQIKLNGRPYKKLYIDYKDIVSGGTLEFFMTDKRP
ncbi:GH92 family glycosyl hydrolase [Hoylesella timonensis]|uniref:Putative alpha-1,2-mannosidase n=1 Tax=Hoylesella timonensis CRIS 5C-B1 TaxID=679189 RepID=D1VYW3_9BACT|nr:GH92 family glycosyl hydrolase [Hoylesella timonensis]EFA97642.1 putative alpha-1,2-mannosidase [Hoylesella timonensis CRIS 5C-B1]